MALIRQVLQHSDRKCWAYIERSDENKHHSIVLGEKEFETQEEAIEFSKGFEPFSYNWVDPKILLAEKIAQMKTELRLLQDNIEEAEDELFCLNSPKAKKS